MKYFNIKRYKFSTILKNINFKRYNFLKIYKYIDLKRLNFKKYYKYIDIRGLNFRKVYKYLDIRKYNFYKIKINLKNYENYFIYFLGAVVFSGFLYIAIPSFYNYDKSKMESVICKNQNIKWHSSKMTYISFTK